jgi:hypothetical protein
MDSMNDTQREPRVTQENATSQADESHESVRSAAPAARLLANPRRVRRD